MFCDPCMRWRCARWENDNWTQPLATVSHGLTDRGFTGHEMLDDLGLIHMNGRIYDPLIGRFLSPDPHIQAPGNLQNYDRYNYVLNNPLSYTDPSGYIFKKLFKSIGNFVSKYWRTIVTVALFAVGAYGLALAFQSVMSYKESGWKGVFVTLGTAALTYGIGQSFDAVQSLGSMEGIFHEAARGISHAVVQGIGAEILGGEFWGGFSAGFMGSMSGSIMGQTGFQDSFSTQTGRVVTAAIVGGTFSVLGGGKFANGAISAAMVQALNKESEKAHGGEERGWFGRAADRTKAFFGFSEDGGFLGTNLTLGEAAYSALEGASEGAQVWFDKMIPGYDPFADSGFGTYRVDDETLAWSHYFGDLSQNAAATAVGLRGAAWLGGTRFGHGLNHNRYFRIGPGRMPQSGNLPASTHAPRMSIGPQRPGGSNPHFDLRLQHFRPGN